ncbi:hypothetical protein ACI65C_003912 [Semiaphis heraclei]
MKNYLSGLNAEFLLYLKFVLDPSSLCRNFRFRQTAHCATYRACNPPPARDPGEPPPTRSNLACHRTSAVLAVILRTPPISHIRTAQQQQQQSHGYVSTTDGRNRNGPCGIRRSTECFKIAVSVAVCDETAPPR